MLRGRSSLNTVPNADRKYHLPISTAPDAESRCVTKEGEEMAGFHVSREQLLTKYGFGPEAMKKIKVCRVCGRACDSGELYCESCGVVLPKETLFDLYRSQHLCCPECDTVVSKYSRFCPKCGRQLWREVIIPPPVYKGN